MGIIKNETTNRYGRLVVLESAGYKGKHAKWRCLCDCGKEKIALGINLRKGHTQSCGCLKLESSIERARALNSGDLRSVHPLYNIWKNMIDRCDNMQCKSYKYYGARGIKVCKEWYDFWTFVKDVSPRTSFNHSLDRKDNNGNYTKINCRWSTHKEQMNNTRLMEIA